MLEAMTQNKWMSAAGCLMALTVLVHVFAGGPENYAPLRASDDALPEIARSVLSVVWHAITVILIGFAVTLFILVRRENAGLFWLVLSIQLGFAFLFLVYGIADFGSLWPMPQWIIFSGIPVLMLMGRRSA